MSTIIKLDSLDNAFTQGGNRLCFFDPRDNNRCIKIVRPDRTPELRRNQKKFPKNLKPLSRFDENKNELLEVEKIQKRIGEEAFLLIPRYFGMVETDFGDGLCLEMIRDFDGKISLSLKQYLWVHGFTQSLQKAFLSFSNSWSDLGMPSRDLLLHNIVVQQSQGENKLSEVNRLVVIDGLGWSGLPVLYYFSSYLARAKARKKIEKLKGAIANILAKKESDSDWGYHGWLNEDQRESKIND